MKVKAFCALVVVGLLGCQGHKADRLTPVAGKVSVDGAPLTSGAVTFMPDADKGNRSPHIPVGNLDGNGRYELSSATKKGAPLGWYKVAITSQEPIDPKNPYAPPKPLIHPKFGDAGTSGLAVEVREG